MITPNFLERDDSLQIVIELDKEVFVVNFENHTMRYCTDFHIFIFCEYRQWGIQESFLRG